MTRERGTARPGSLAGASLGALLFIGGAQAGEPDRQAPFMQLADNLFDLPKVLRRSGDAKRLPLKSWGSRSGADRPEAWSRLRTWLDRGAKRGDGGRSRPQTNWAWDQHQADHDRSDRWPRLAPWWRGYDGSYKPDDDPWHGARPPLWYDAQRYAPYPSYYGARQPYPAYGGYAPYPNSYYDDPYYGYDRHDDNDEVWGWLAFTAIVWKLLDNLNADQQRQHERAMARAENAPLGQPASWHSGSAAGSVTPTRESPGASGPCREFRHEIDVGGRKEVAYETACQLPDGSWEIVR